MEYTEIGRRIKERRNELSISAVDLAASVALSKATIHRYENGDIRNIKLPVVESIARALKVNPLWLIGKSDHMEVEVENEEDLLFLIDKLMAHVRDSAYLTANGVRIEGESKRIVLTSLGFTRDYVSKIK